VRRCCFVEASTNILKEGSPAPQFVSALAGSFAVRAASHVSAEECWRIEKKKTGCY